MTAFLSGTELPPLSAARLPILTLCSLQTTIFTT